MANPLFSQQVQIGTNGIARLSMIGGSPLDADNDGKGYLIPPSYGVLHMFSPHGAEAILDCRAAIYGYQNHAVDEVALPGEVVIDVPSSVEIRGPVGTIILLQVWPTFAVQSRGGRRSYFKAAGAGVLSGEVPRWANAWDYGGGADVTFYRDALLAVPVGFFVGDNPIVGMSVPSDAAYFATANVADALSLIFRQQ